MKYFINISVSYNRGYNYEQGGGTDFSLWDEHKEIKVVIRANNEEILKRQTTDVETRYFYPGISWEDDKGEEQREIVLSDINNHLEKDRQNIIRAWGEKLIVKVNTNRKWRVLLNSWIEEFKTSIRIEEIKTSKAFLMGTHPRLGADSPVRCLDKNLRKTIVESLFPSPSPKEAEEDPTNKGPSNSGV